MNERTEKVVLGCSYSRKETNIIEAAIVCQYDDDRKNLIVKVSPITLNRKNAGLDEIANTLNQSISGLRHKPKEGWITPHEALLVRLKQAEEYWHELSLNPKEPKDEDTIEMLKDHAFSLKEKGQLIMHESIDLKNPYCFKSYLLALKGTIPSFTGELSTAGIYKRLRKP